MAARLENRCKYVLIGRAVQQLREKAAAQSNTKIGKMIKQFFLQAKQECLTSLLNVCERTFKFFLGIGLDYLLVDETPVRQISRMSTKDLDAYLEAHRENKKIYFGSLNFIRFYKMFIEKFLPKTPELEAFKLSSEKEFEEIDELQRLYPNAGSLPGG